MTHSGVFDHFQVFLELSSQGTGVNFYCGRDERLCNCSVRCVPAPSVLVLHDTWRMLCFCCCHWTPFTSGVESLLVVFLRRKCFFRHPGSLLHLRGPPAFLWLCRCSAVGFPCLQGQPSLRKCFSFSGSCVISSFCPRLKWVPVYSLHILLGSLALLK